MFNSKKIRKKSGKKTSSKSPGGIALDDSGESSQQSNAARQPLTGGLDNPDLHRSKKPSDQDVQDLLEFMANEVREGLDSDDGLVKPRESEFYSLEEQAGLTEMFSSAYSNVERMTAFSSEVHSMMERVRDIMAIALTLISKKECCCVWNEQLYSFLDSSIVKILVL